MATTPSAWPWAARACTCSAMRAAARRITSSRDERPSSRVIHCAGVESTISAPSPSSSRREHKYRISSCLVSMVPMTRALFLSPWVVMALDPLREKDSLARRFQDRGRLAAVADQVHRPAALQDGDQPGVRLPPGGKDQRLVPERKRLVSSAGDAFQPACPGAFDLDACPHLDPELGKELLKALPHAGVDTGENLLLPLDDGHLSPLLGGVDRHFAADRAGAYHDDGAGQISLAPQGVFVGVGVVEPAETLGHPRGAARCQHDLVGIPPVDKLRRRA